jgi:DNA-binding transcriptional LysR family regulator
MPTAFPEGKATVRDVYEGDPSKQLAALWSWLKDADKAGLPEGLVGNVIELRPDARPVIYRNFIEGLSARGIAVGYPERANLAWDANKLSLTQPAVSNALQRLREALGDDLMKRSGQEMSPTPRALALWPAVRDALGQLEGALVPGQFVPAQASNTFILAMADSTAAKLMPGLLAAMDQTAPGVSIRVVPLTTRDPRRLLEDETLDLAIGYFPATMADLTARIQSGAAVAFSHERLYSGEYVCVMRSDHPLATESLTLANYCAARHLLVSFSGRPFGFVDEALAAVLGAPAAWVLALALVAAAVVAGARAVQPVSP